jgi:serine/threonine protein kinase
VNTTQNQVGKSFDFNKFSRKDKHIVLNQNPDFQSPN